MSLNDGFELQVKANNNVNSQTIFCESALNGDSNVCFYVALGNRDTDIGSYYNGYIYTVRFSFGTIPNKMHYFRYKYLNDTMYFKLLDEDMNVYLNKVHQCIFNLEIERLCLAELWIIGINLLIYQ